MVNLPDLVCTSNLHEPHQNKNHSLNKAAEIYKTDHVHMLALIFNISCGLGQGSDLLVILRPSYGPWLGITDLCPFSRLTLMMMNTPTVLITY